MIFQNRGQFGGQVARIGVLPGTSRARYVKMTRFWKIVSPASNKFYKVFICKICACNHTLQRKIPAKAGILHKKERGLNESDTDLLSQRRIGRQYHRP